MSESWVTLRSPDIVAAIDPSGAQLSMLRDCDGHDLLWDGDPAYWTGRAPILFPIVGMLAGGSYLSGSQRYPLPRHGFARGKPFATVATTPSSAVFRLGADAATLAVYPFRFELTVAFELTGPMLAVSASVRNTGAEALPASLGFHPGFRWPLPDGQPRAEHFLEFEVDERAPIRRLDASGLLSPVAQPTPVTGRRLLLDDALFAEDVIIFDKLRSRSVTYGAGTGPRLRIGFPDATYLGVWTKPGAPFVCIEPWQGVSDPADHASDIRSKPGILSVEPETTQTLSMTITLQR